MRKSELLQAGEKYNRLTVLGLDHIETRQRKNGQNSNIEYYKCKCDCGNEVLVQKACLKNNHVQSCGCLNLENHTKHNGRHTRLYKIWVGMKNRCNNPNTDCWDNYGGRGIKVCNEWVNNFSEFRDWALDNEYDETLTIDRINVNGNYEPNNCRWVTKAKQTNNKRNNYFIEYNNEKRTISEWAKLRGIKKDTLRNRVVKLHWNIPKALGFEQ